MKKSILIVSIIFLLSGLSNAQTSSTTEVKPSPTPTASPQKTIRKPSFRANKEQVMQVQKMLKEKNLYAGEADGKRSEEFKTSVKSYQKDNGLKQSGTLNRATLEKMGIMLTDKQKEIAVNPKDFASAETTATTTKRTIFRASKEQIMAAQKILKDGGMYAGEQTGKLDDATREGLRKYQAANALTVTGTLNQVTLEKMGVALTDKQKADAAAKTSE